MLLLNKIGEYEILDLILIYLRFSQNKVRVILIGGKLWIL